jgi:hypothetical protein
MRCFCLKFGEHLVKIRMKAKKAKEAKEAKEAI